ncbi:MAG: hypothetical protein ACUVSK_13275 [Desulfotomaculales bacterium]
MNGHFPKRAAVAQKAEVGAYFCAEGDQRLPGLLPAQFFEDFPGNKELPRGILPFVLLSSKL